MPNTKSLTNLIGLIVSTGVAAISSAYFPFMIGGLISGISTNLASEFVNNINYGRLKNWLFTPHPDQLNHDLQKAMKEAILVAVSNVEVLYGEQTDNEEASTKTREIFKQLKMDIRDQLPPSSLQPLTDVEISGYLYDDPEQANKQLFDRLAAAFENVSEQTEIIQFFETNFIPQIQLCFGEILKDNDHHKAWIAFQRFLMEEMRSDIKSVLANQETIKQQIAETSRVAGIKFPRLSKKQLKALSDLANELNQPIRFEDRFQKAFDEALKEIPEKINTLLTTTAGTHHIVQNIDAGVQAQQQRLHRIERQVKTQWISQKTVWIYAALAVAILSAVFVWQYYRQQPFSVTVYVHGNKGKDDLILQNRGAVELTLGDRKARAEITQRGEAVFKQIPAVFKNKHVKIAITDTRGERYKMQNADSILLRSNQMYEIPIMLEGLNNLSGVVYDFISGNYLPGVVVRIQEASDTTDETGRFSIDIPPAMQQRFQDVSFYKKGYKPREDIEVPIQTDELMKVHLTPTPYGDSD